MQANFMNLYTGPRLSDFFLRGQGVELSLVLYETHQFTMTFTKICPGPYSKYYDSSSHPQVPFLKITNMRTPPPLPEI